MTTDNPMQLGMIGLGRMGANLVRRLMRDGHRCVVYDVNADAVAELEKEGRHRCRAPSRSSSAHSMYPGRCGSWCRPGTCRTPSTNWSSSWHADDVVIDGGNSYYRDDIARAAQLQPKGIHYVDCGTSGGVWGLERGYCLMIGGEDEAVERLDPIFATIAPGEGERRSHAGRDQPGGTAQDGYLHCGPNGAGHFVKMVHNGVEYGMMAAIAEGLSIIKHADAGLAPAGDRCRDHPASRPRVLPVRDRRGGGCGGVAPRFGDRFVAGRPDRCGARRSPRICRTTRAGCPTPARVAGRSSPGSRRACRRASSPLR